MNRRALTCAVLLLVGAARHAPAADDEVDRAEMKKLVAMCTQFAEGDGDGGRLLVMAEAEKLPPLPAAAVDDLVTELVDLRRKHGPKLKKRGKAYFYGDGDDERGLYIVSAGKKGGGLLLSLHGGGEGQGDAGGAHGTWSSATAQGFTVISPEVMKKVSSAWNEEREEAFVLDLIDAAKRTFTLDTDRICIAGHSMGGDGSWMIGGRNADLFAAASPLAGSVMPYMRPGTLNRLETPLSAYEGLMEGVLPNLMHVPYHIHHSDDDRNEAIHPDDIATGYLERLGQLFPGKYVFTYDRVSGNGHALPRSGVKPIIKWMAEQRRVTYPDEVVWETWWGWKRQMYWLYHHEPKRAWRFHGKVVGRNHVDLTATSKPEAGRKEPTEFELRLLLSPRMFDFGAPLRVTSGDRTLYEGPIERSLWALMATAGQNIDPKHYYEGHLDVKVPRVPWNDLWEADTR